MIRPERVAKRLSCARFVLTAFLAVVDLAALVAPSSAEKALAVPSPAVDETSKVDGLETAVFAGGCFWGVQGVFQHVKGVTAHQFDGGARISGRLSDPSSWAALCHWRDIRSCDY